MFASLKDFTRVRGVEVKDPTSHRTEAFQMRRNVRMSPNEPTLTWRTENLHRQKNTIITKITAKVVVF